MIDTPGRQWKTDLRISGDSEFVADHFSIFEEH